MSEECILYEFYVPLKPINKIFIVCWPTRLRSSQLNTNVTEFIERFK